MTRWISLLIAPVLLAPACAVDGSPEGSDSHPEIADLPLGDRAGTDSKADRWGHALDCKPIPEVEQLVDPLIVVSVDGLTLHLTDRAGSYDRVFPVGVGAINDVTGERTEGESLTMYPVLADGTKRFEIDTSNNWSFNSCRVWWTSSDTGEELPVFAGLPFMRFRGAYGIHGPITNFHAPNGGQLKRGFVSHGCVRMEAADVVEVYGRISGVAKVPVIVQREPERRADGSRVDVDDVWVGAACEVNDDCNYEGGFCKTNPYGGGFCSMRCTGYCPDRPFAPVTYCVTDPDDSNLGMCTIKETDENQDCRPYNHLQPTPSARFKSPTKTARVCLPGSRGFIGDRCLENDDCQDEMFCGGDGDVRVCTSECARYCPDQAGVAMTFCAADTSLGAAACARRCTPDSNASECATGTTCQAASRPNQSGMVRHVCVP